MKVYPATQGHSALLCLLVGHVILDGACTRAGCHATGLR